MADILAAPSGEYAETRDRAVRGSRVMLVRHATVGVLSLLGSTLLIRHVAASDWASYSIAYYLIVFFDIAFGANVLGAVVRAPARPDPRRLQSAAFLMQVVGVGLAGFFVVLSGPLADLYGQSSLAPCLLAVAACTYVYATRSLSTALLERDLEYRGVALAEVLDQLTFYAVAIPLVLTGHGIEGLALALAARGILAAVLLRRFAPTPLVGRPNREELRVLMAYAIPTLGSSGVILLNGFIPVVALGGDNAEVLAFTLTASTIIGYAASVQVVAQRVGFPTFAQLQDDPERFRSAIGSTMNLAGVLMASLVVPMVATGPLWLPLLFGSVWVDASVPMAVIGAGLLVNGVTSIATSALASIDRPRDAFRLQAGMTAVYLVTAIPLAFESPLWGPSLGYLLSRLAGVVLVRWLMRSAATAVPLRGAVGVALAAGAAAGGLAYLFWKDLPELGVVGGFALALAWVGFQRRPLARTLGWLVNRPARA